MSGATPVVILACVFLVVLIVVAAVGATQANAKAEQKREREAEQKRQIDEYRRDFEARQERWKKSAELEAELLSARSKALRKAPAWKIEPRNVGGYALMRKGVMGFELIDNFETVEQARARIAHLQQPAIEVE